MSYEEACMADQLENWLIEAGLASDRNRVIFRCFTDLPAGTLGETHIGETAVAGRPAALIFLSERLTHRPLTSQAVLWHECAHCIAWLENGASQGHGSRFRRILWRKPALAFWDEVFASAVYRLSERRG